MKIQISERMRSAHESQVASSMQREWFPSTLAYITADQPGLRGEDRDWAIFLHGVKNGAAKSYELLTPPLEKSDLALGESFRSLEKALELSDALDVDALEHLLAARNVLAKHAAKCWEAFMSQIEDWASIVMGLRLETLRLASPGRQECDDLGDAFLKMLNEGHFHPFFIWLTLRHEHGKVTIQDIRRVLMNPTGIPSVLLREVIGQSEIAKSVHEYLGWAKSEHKRMVGLIREHAKDDVVPTQALAEWIGTNLLLMEEDDD